jgi:hypothetical protein
MKPFAICLVLMAGGPAHALTAGELQGLLTPAVQSAVTFVEIRESPWLTTPVQSRGSMHNLPPCLEKRVSSPKQETWRLCPDRMEWVGPGGAPTRQMPFSRAPALAVLANAMRSIVAGELQALEPDFTIAPQGDAERWTVQLQPKDAAAARSIDHIELQGSGGRLSTVVVLERGGERTTTRFGPPPAN